MEGGREGGRERGREADSLPLGGRTSPTGLVNAVIANCAYTSASKSYIIQLFTNK